MSIAAGFGDGFGTAGAGVFCGGCAGAGGLYGTTTGTGVCDGGVATTSGTFAGFGDWLWCLGGFAGVVMTG